MRPRTHVGAAVAAATAGLLLGALLAPPAAAVPTPAGAQPSAQTTAQARTAASGTRIRACRDRRTGVVRILLRRKNHCRPGERRITWPVAPAAGSGGAPGTAGPAGAAGATGAAGSTMYAADGTALGTWLGTFAEGMIQLHVVLIDGGAYRYLSSGQLFAEDDVVLFTDSACATTPYARSTGGPTPTTDMVAVYGGMTRFVGYAGGGALAAYRTTGATMVVNPAGISLYTRDSAGACVASSGNPYSTGTLHVLESLITPPQPTGPLTIGRPAAT